MIFILIFIKISLYMDNFFVFFWFVIFDQLYGNNE